MLYPRRSDAKLDTVLFQNPSAEYRSAPFWAWNCQLNAKELEFQLAILKKMGFGGAHLHVRTGLSIPYLGDEFLSLIRDCARNAKQNGMRTYLYDEDRWPSGSAGGLVTRDPKYRARYLLFTPLPYGSGKSQELISQAAGGRTEKGTLLSCYDIQLDKSGRLLRSRRIGPEEAVEGEKWYAYLEISEDSPWFNNQAYVNTLDKKAMDRFIEITYESYNRILSDEFGTSVPSIFTDEPQFTRKAVLPFATDKVDVTLPWTDDLPETFSAVYGGEDLLEGIPDLIWDRADGRPSLLRYHYHDHVCQLFTQAFSDNCGAWCRDHHLALTGHMDEEPTLEKQTRVLGEAMRAYRSFEIPGIDMLCNRYEYTTAKQAQSAVHQFGREGMLSELYGVTGWDFDFRGYKRQGDWQAALGVTLRVPHLSWVSMKGEAKRDYPASISFQSPWWKKYSLLEDHFARVATAMTRGKPVVKVGVIHPVESYWLHWGPAEQTATVRDELDQNFQNLTRWLLFGGIDFDFISESLLPQLCPRSAAPLPVGEMNYDVILVPGCETLRSSTLERLEAFAAAGGKLVFAGAVPTLTDAVPSQRAARLADRCPCIPLSRGAVLNALESERVVEIRNADGSLTENLLYQMRSDGCGRWLFLAHGTEPYNKDISTFQDLRIRIPGRWTPQLYNTENGQIEEIDFTVLENCTEIRHRLYEYDSLLLWLDCDVHARSGCGASVPSVREKNPKLLPPTCRYTLDEPNALLLDQAEWSLDDGPFMPQEEILRLDSLCRKKLGLPMRKKACAQPWVLPDMPISHHVRLRWHIRSTIEASGISLAIEDAEQVRLCFNGIPVENKITGWYVDKAIQTLSMPPLKTGENLLEADIPFGARTNIEWAYLLGDFGVDVHGRSVTVIPARKELAFGDISGQGLPFYGGNITYHIPVPCRGGELILRSSHYRGGLQTVSLDHCTEEQAVIYPPYTVSLGRPEAGIHTVDLTLFGNRHNAFGPIHLADRKETWIGPDAWRSDGDCWCYDYMLKEVGVLTTPVITELL